jgi:hypothetical protein
VQLPQRDFDGSMYRVQYQWRPTDVLTLTAAVQRDLSTNEEVNVGFVLIEGVALYSHWDVSDKVDLSIDLEDGDRRYLGDPAFVLGVAPARSERVRLTGVRLLYRPTRILTLDFGWRTERRSSAIAFGNYDVGIASVGARVTF